MKNKILRTLKDGAPGYVSGEALSESLGVSRTAIWKHINELKKDGYVIESSTGNGYRLVPVPDILNAFEITYHLETQLLGRNTLFFSAIDSTNDYAKKAASEGCAEGTAVVAGTQTAGRGRMGRAWDSADGKGVWMSVVLRPAIAPEEAPLITLAASVAVVCAIREVTGIEAGIKWPNDIVLDGKKVCGILTEMNAEMGQVHFLVVGIGINVNQEPEDFPEELRETAASLKMYARPGQAGGFARCEIIKKILFKLEQMYNKMNIGCKAELIDEWKKYAVTLGREARVNIKGCEYVGIARDVTEDGRLVVDCNDGVTREVLSGEVSIRGMLGYT